MTRGEGVTPGGDGEKEVDRICGIFERGVKMPAFFAASRLFGECVSEADLDRLREMARSLREAIDGQCQ